MSNIVVVVDEVTRFVKIIEGGPQGPAGPGVPVGGSTGNVLAKASPDDYDTEWTSTPFLTRVDFDTDPGEAVSDAGQVGWNQAERTFDAGLGSGAIMQVGQEQHYPLCRNNEGIIIRKGQPVMVDPTDINTGDHFNIVLANANSTYPHYLFLGVAYEDIDPAALGIVTFFGRINGTSLTYIKPNAETWAEGDILWVGTIDGKYTKTKPSLPLWQIPVAVVLQISGSTAKLIVRPTIDGSFGNLQTANMSFVSGTGAFNSNNSTEYIAQFDTITDQNTLEIAPDNATNNMILTQPGRYHIEACVAFYDLLLGSFLRMSLRASNAPILTAAGGTLEARIAVASIPTNINGEAFVRGSYVYNKTTTGNTYLAITFLHAGAVGGGGTAFPVNGNGFGNMPHFRVTKLD